MKVLLPIIYHELTECIARAWRNAGHTVQVVDWRRAARKSNAEATCIRQAMQFRPDIAFCQFQSPNIISAAFPLALRSIGCYSINWSGDVRSPLPDWYKQLAPHFDVTAFTNIPDVEEIRSLGCRSEFLQIGYDETIYHSVENDNRQGVVFIGNNYHNKFEESSSRRDMVRAMAEAYPDQFKVYGMGWETVAPRGWQGYIREPMDAIILRDALVAVGWDHFHRAGFASDRLLRATACGCAVVNQHYDGIEQEHPHVFAVSTIDDMVEQVGHLLQNPQVAVSIGRANAINTKQQHRWDNRVNNILSWTTARTESSNIS